MTTVALDRLGEFLMRQVRDKAISDWDRILDGSMKGTTAEQVRRELSSPAVACATILNNLVPRIVDSALHHLLRAIEQQEDVDIAVGDGKGGLAGAREASDGLSGELYGKRGWIARFSKARHGE